jgi:hypothetical protein
VIISLVPADHVRKVWPAVADYVQNALEYTDGRYELEDVLEMVEGGGFLLWIAFDGKQIRGCVITQMMQYPRKKFLGCPFVTGDEFASWKQPMFEMLQRFARDNDCEGLEATARLGWSRVFKDDGYEAMWQTFQLPAAGVNNG